MKARPDWLMAAVSLLGVLGYSLTPVFLLSNSGWSWWAIPWLVPIAVGLECFWTSLFGTRSSRRAWREREGRA